MYTIFYASTIDAYSVIKYLNNFTHNMPAILKYNAINKYTKLFVKISK